MKKALYLLFLILLGAGCNKKSQDLAWERTYGQGEAFFVELAADSGYVACGRSGVNPYLIRLDGNKNIIVEFSAETTGAFTSVVYDTSGYLAAGSTEGKMLIMRFSRTGNRLWEKIIDPGFNVDLTRILVLGNNNYLALGSANPDTMYSEQTGIVFISVDSTGQVLKEQNFTDGFFIAANDIAADDQGNLYLAITRREEETEPKATVARFNNSFQRIWELELANNPAFGAASLSIVYDQSGTLFASGRTELPKEGGGTINNSFVANISLSGDLVWKKYPEVANSAVSMLVNDAGELVVLNSNCFFVNILSATDGSDGGRIRVFDACDPNTTGAFAFDFDIDVYGDIILAGSLNGNFYLGVKAL